MMKKTLLYTFFFLGFMANLFAQTQLDSLIEAKEDAFLSLAAKASQKAIADKNAAIFEEHLKENPAPTKKMRAWTNIGRAYILWQINDATLKKDTKSANSDLIVKEVLQIFQQGIDSCLYCSVANRLERLAFLEAYNLLPDFQKNELKELKKAGYRASQTGISLGVNLSQGKDTWIGGQIGFFSFNDPRYSLKSFNDQTAKLEEVRKVKRTTMGHLMSVAFNLNVQQKTSEFSLSIFQMSAPIMFDVTKFGYRNFGEGKKGSGFYRPEIGLGLGAFSISYGYNHLFNKAYRPLYERHLLNLRFTPIVVKTKL